jgi:hypothetical protein
LFHQLLHVANQGLELWAIEVVDSLRGLAENFGTELGDFWRVVHIDSVG